MRVLLIAAMILNSPLQASENVKLNIPNMLKGAEVKYDLPQGLLQAVAEVESSTDHTAYVHSDGKSGKASLGLLQIQVASARVVGFKGKAKDLMKPETNIEYGAAYLRWLLDTHENNIAWALTCWNAGPNSKVCKNKRYIHYVGLIFNAWMRQNAGPDSEAL